MEDKDQDLTALFQKELQCGIDRASAIAALELFQVVSNQEVDSKRGRQVLDYYSSVLPKISALSLTASGKSIEDRIKDILFPQNSTRNLATENTPSNIVQVLPAPEKEVRTTSRGEDSEVNYRGLQSILPELGVSSGKITPASKYLRDELEKKPNRYISEHSMGESRKRFEDTAETREILKIMLISGGYIEPTQKQNKPEKFRAENQKAGSEIPDGFIPYSPLTIETRTGITAEFVESNSPLLEVMTDANGRKHYNPRKLNELTAYFENVKSIS